MLNCIILFRIHKISNSSAKMHQSIYLLLLLVLLQNQNVESTDVEGYDDWVLKMAEYKKISEFYNEIEEKNDGTKMTGIGDFNLTFGCSTSSTDQSLHSQDGIISKNSIQVSRHSSQQLFKSKPISVHQLTPSDIDVVGAIGDSITAGSGAEATTIAGIAVANRGLAWSMGGDGDMDSSVTLPNILRNYRPDLKGYSKGKTPPDYNLIWFNEAIPGARAMHMPNQAWDLVNSMKNDSRINFEEDWKMISLFIGGNDLCALQRDDESTPKKYIGYVQEALDILHQEIPRALVNLVEVMEILVMREVGYGDGGTERCRDAQAAYCPYVFESNDTELQNIKQINHEYQELTQQLVGSGRYDTRDDFTVVLQPFLRETALPLTEEGKVDTSYFAVDCFHFSTKGHALAAINLWNSLFEPVGTKSTSWTISEPKCPTEEAPFIFTNLNSMAGSNETTSTSPVSLTTSTDETTTKPIQVPISTTSAAQKLSFWFLNSASLCVVFTCLSQLMVVW